MDKYVGGDRSNRQPMIKRKTESEVEAISYNSIDLYYVLRKKDTDKIKNIQILKEHLGD